MENERKVNAMDSELKKELLDKANELSALADEIEGHAQRLDEIRAQIEGEMTVRKNTGSGIPLYYIADETFVRLNDVLQLCADLKKKFEKGTEKGFIDPDEHSRISASYALTKLQTQLYKNETEKADSVDEHKQIIESRSGKNRKPKIPARYAVGRKYDTDNNYWMFYLGVENGKPIFTNMPCKGIMYKSYKEAEACADFMDDDGWEVCDMYEYMSTENRFCRQLLCAPEEYDVGNENAVRLHR